MFKAITTLVETGIRNAVGKDQSTRENVKKIIHKKRFYEKADTTEDPQALI